MNHTPESDFFAAPVEQTGIDVGAGVVPGLKPPRASRERSRLDSVAFGARGPSLERGIR